MRGICRGPKALRTVFSGPRLRTIERPIIFIGFQFFVFSYHKSPACVMLLYGHSFTMDSINDNITISSLNLLFICNYKFVMHNTNTQCIGRVEATYPHRMEYLKNPSSNSCGITHI